MREKWSGIRSGGFMRNPIRCGRKFCSGCGRWRHVCDFGSNGYGPSSKCRPCIRADARRRHAETRADAERAALKREYDRFYAEARRREAGIPPRQFKNRRSVVDRLERVFFDTDPLLEAMAEYRKAFGLSWKDMARIMGLNDRTLYRWRTGEAERVRIDKADQIAYRMGMHLSDIYPPGTQPLKKAA